MIIYIFGIININLNEKKQNRYKGSRLMGLVGLGHKKNDRPTGSTIIHPITNP